MKQVTFFLKGKIHIHITKLIHIILATLNRKNGSFMPLFSEFLQSYDLSRNQTVFDISSASATTWLLKVDLPS